MTLIEVLLAITLELLLIAFLFETYLAHQYNFQLQFNLQRLQTQAQLAMDVLQTAITQAGYIGCPLLTEHLPIAASPSYQLSVANQLTGSIANEITVRYLEQPYARLLTQDNPQSTEKIVSAKPVLPARAILLITDCQRAEVFQQSKVIASKQQQKIILDRPLHYTFQSYAAVGRLAINKYFVAKTQRNYADGSPIYALFVEDIQLRKTELIEGVQAMRLYYSVQQGEQLIDLPAQQITDWSKVRGVAFELDIYYPPIRKTWYGYVSRT
jgi:hypothetical protein